MAKGENVAATTRNKKELENGIDARDNFLPIQMDLTDEASVKLAIDAAILKFGSLDVIINNAG